MKFIRHRQTKVYMHTTIYKTIKTGFKEYTITINIAFTTIFWK